MNETTGKQMAQPVEGRVYYVTPALIAHAKVYKEVPPRYHLLFKELLPCEKAMLRTDATKD